MSKTINHIAQYHRKITKYHKIINDFFKYSSLYFKISLKKETLTNLSISFHIFQHTREINRHFEKEIRFKIGTRIKRTFRTATVARE